MNNIIGYVKPPTEPDNGPVGVTYAEANTRDIEPIAGQDAPDPVRQSNFISRPSRMPKIVYLNIPGIQSIMQNEFGYPLFAAQHTAHSLAGYGGQQAWEERTNIEAPIHDAYGSQYVMSSVPDQNYYPLNG